MKHHAFLIQNYSKIGRAREMCVYVCVCKRNVVAFDGDIEERERKFNTNE